MSTLRSTRSSLIRYRSKYDPSWSEQHSLEEQWEIIFAVLEDDARTRELTTKGTPEHDQAEEYRRVGTHLEATLKKRTRGKLYANKRGEGLRIQAATGEGA